VEIVKQVRNPDVWILRNQELARARKAPPPSCPHPFSALEQFVDEEPGRAGRPTNLFSCRICHSILWLSDAWGKEAADG
jgi:hypothetical protein